MKLFSDPAINIYVLLAAISGLLALGLGAYWLWRRKAKQEFLMELEATLDKMLPTDPQYSHLRALYVSLSIEAHRQDFFNSERTDNGSFSNDGISDSGGDSD